MIKCFSKSSFLKIVCLAVLCCGMTGNAWATCGNPGKKCPDTFDLSSHALRVKAEDAKAPKEMKEYYQKLKSLKSNIELLCQKGDEQISYTFCITSEELVEGMQKAKVYSKYQEFKNQFNTLLQKMLDYEDPNNCGAMHPYGCPEGQECYVQKSNVAITRGGMNAHEINVDSKEPVCLAGTPDTGKYDRVHSNITQTVEKKAETAKDKTIETKTTSVFSTGLGTHSEIDPNGNVSMETTYAGGTLIDWGTFDAAGREKLRTNESCKIDALYEDYMGSCYSCIIVSALINTFMQVAEKLAPIMQLAGTRLLIIGIPLWLVFYIIQKIVSLVSLEPMKILNDLFKFFFKCLLAYVLITSGVRAISKLMVNPLLGAGADYGINIVDSVMPENVSKNVTSKLNKDTKTYKIASSNNVDQKVFDKIMLLSRKADAAVSLNFVIGNALICHSYNAGAHLLSEKLAEYTKIKLYFPDFWLMLCGVLIWFFAFMLTIGVNFYLLDLSFKIGFALLALPVTLGLWPFEKFKDKFGICIKLIANAAGTFMFLGITTGMSVALISASLGGTDKLLGLIKEGNQSEVSRIFGFTSGAFILIFFAFFYSHKLISETVSKLADKFFGSVLSGVSPMANKATQAVDMAKKGVMKVAGGVYGATAGKAVNAVKTAAKNVARNAGRGAVKGIRKGVRAIRGR